MGDPIKPVNMSGRCFDQMKPLADAVGWSVKQFVEECCNEMAALSETPKGKRTVPKIIRMLDAIKQTEPLPEERKRR